MLNTINHNDPKPFIGLASLMRRAMSGENLTDFVNIAAYNPNSATMLMQMSIIFQLTGNPEMGLELQRKALKLQQLYHLTFSANQAKIRLLAIMRPGDMTDNTPIEFLLEDSDVVLDLLYVSPDLPFPTSLPAHDIIIVAIGQSDQNQPLLEQVGNLIKSSPCPVINAPERISCLSREKVSELLKSAPGIKIPLTTRINRLQLEKIYRNEQSLSNYLTDGGFPIIIRPVGSHAGKGLAKLDNADTIADYLSTMPDDEFNIAHYVAYQRVDGLFRKCRIALIEGHPFACHLAISENWIVHYVKAGMEENVTKRAEEANFMANFDIDFGKKHQEAFRIIGERLGLNYLVIDCAETHQGDLLIFEADNLGFVHAMDSVDIYPYKQSTMKKVFSAFYKMLEQAKGITDYKFKPPSDYI